MSEDKGIKFSGFMHCLKEGQRIRIKLSGHSMEPTYMDGDFLVLRIGVSHISLGDIVARYDLDDIITLHRVVDVREENGKVEFLTKGDHNYYVDNWCSMNDIIGVVINESDGYISSDYLY